MIDRAAINLHNYRLSVQATLDAQHRGKPLTVQDMASMRLRRSGFARWTGQDKRKPE